MESQLVVHLIENWEAGFASTQHFRRPDELSPECPTNGSQSRADVPAGYGTGSDVEAGPASFNVSAKTAAKWVRRYRELGVDGLRDRSSRPGRLHRPTSTELIGRVEALPRERWTGLRIAQATG